MARGRQIVQDMGNVADDQDNAGGQRQQEPSRRQVQQAANYRPLAADGNPLPDRDQTNDMA